jgi:hypothetical protein
MDGIHLNKAFMETDGFSIESYDGQNLRHDSGSQSHVHHNQDAQKMAHRLVQCCLSVDDGQDKDVGNERQKVEHSQGQGEPVLPVVLPGNPTRMNSETWNSELLESLRNWNILY